MSCVKISKVDVIPFRYSFPNPVKNSHQEWHERKGLELRIWDQHGIIGLGEASPLPGYSSDTFVEAQAELQRLSFMKLPFLWPEEGLESAIDGFLTPLSIETPSARFAIETALLDLIGKYYGLPISKLFQALPIEVPLSAFIFGGTTEEILAAAKQALRDGITTLKYKIGHFGMWRQEVETLRQLRKECKDSFQLRLDVNRVWSRQEAAVRLHELKLYQPEFVEEPTREVPLGIKVPVPIALDESLQNPRVLTILPEILARDQCQVLVLKPMMLGGFFACFRLVRLAKFYGTQFLITHSFDGPIAIAATVELALALSQHQGLRPCSLNWPPPESGTAYSKLVQKSKNVVIPHSRPGLGIESTLSL